MKKNRTKKMALAAMLALVVVGVALGVHIMHKQAYAVETRSCILIKNDDMEQRAIGYTVQFSKELSQAPEVWSDWQNGDEGPDGEYSYQFPSITYRWRVRVLLPLHGDQPNGDVQTFYATDPESFDWVVWTEGEWNQ
jgi:hypothetical protein